MPKNDTRPTRVRLRTKKNPDGSQQYVRGKTNDEQFMTVTRNLDKTYPDGSSKARKMLLDTMVELNKPVLNRIQIRKKRDVQNNNADRSR
jgi:hypothetical protein